MKNSIIVLLLLIVACGSSKEMYTYQPEYDNSYERYLEKSPDALKKSLQEIFKNAERDKNYKVPPGSYLEYGYILLKENNRDLANKYFQKEIEQFPESERFIKVILAKYEKP